MDVVPTCTSCGEFNNEGARFCAQCGTPLPAPGGSSSGATAVEERRYCTVVFCDLVESTSLSEELGPEQYKDVADVIYGFSRTIINRYGGEVSQYLGDGVLALFGHRGAHEDDAVRAVCAALDIQAAIRSCGDEVRQRVPDFSRVLHSRAAVHTGLVLITDVRESGGRRVAAFGDTVSIAARLQAEADPDSLIISGSTRRLVGDRFALSPAARTTIRGIRNPLETFQVTSVAAHVGRHDAARGGSITPLVGREDELRVLEDTWTRVVSGEGQIVVLSGDPGIGKSRLLAEMKHRRGLAGRWFELHGSEFLQASELRPVLELLERHVLEGTAGLEARQRLQHAMDESGIGDVEAVRGLASLLSLPVLPDDPPLTLLPDQQRRKVLDTLVAWVLKLAADSPVVIAFEDIQWADPTTIELLKMLAAAASEHPVLLLVTCRAPFEPPWRPQPYERRLAMQPLTAAEARALVAAVAGHRLPPEPVMREVIDKSDGIPLFLEEVTHMLADSTGVLEAVPDTLRELLSARLDRMSSARDLLRVGSVIGRRFSRELLLAVSERDQDAIDRSIDALLDAGIFLNEDDGYSFKHVLLRDESYDRIPRVTKVQLHGRVAATLQERFPHVAESRPELVAHHLTEAGATEPALREWQRAGLRSLYNAAYAEAAHHLERALTLCARLSRSTQDERTASVLMELELRKDLGLSLIATRGYTSPAVEANYEHALRRSSELNIRSEEVPIPILYGLWGTYFMRGDRRATDELAKQFRRVLESTDPLARHVAHSVLGARAFYLGDFGYSREQFEKAIDLYDPAKHYTLTRDYGYSGGLYSHSYLACLLCFTGYPDRGLAMATEAVELARSLKDPYAQAASLGFAACVARERGESARAGALSAELIELATGYQFILWLGIGLCLSGSSNLAEGNVAGGADQIRTGFQMYEATGAKLPGQYLRLILIEAELAKGDLVTGLAEIEKGLRLCRETFDAYLEPEYHRFKGQLLALDGALDAAEREFREAVDGARAEGAKWMELRAALRLAQLAHRDTGPTDAVTLLGHVMSDLTEGKELEDLADARALLVRAG
jgi:class 3 adenylate cyclase/tetratricopeptide (TPR) repeat protein